MLIIINYFKALVEKEVAIADLKWIFEKGSGRGVYNDYQHVHMDTELVLHYRPLLASKWMKHDQKALNSYH